MATGARVVLFRVLNAQNVSEARPQDEIGAGITRPSAYGEVDVWILSEISWARLEAIAKKHGLHALHFGARGSAEAGVGILSRRPITQGRQLVGTLATREGRGTRMRPLVSGRTFGVRVTAGHAPPPTSPIARALYIARARARRGIVGADWNRDPAWMKATSRREYRGIGVLGLLVPNRFHASAAQGVDVNSDHDAVDVKVTIPVRKTRTRKEN